MEEGAFIENCKLGMIVVLPVIVSAQWKYGCEGKREQKR
jgi:hypothetical protein